MTLRTIFLALLTVISTAAFAHDDETLARMPAPHGGQLRMEGRYHVELVLEPSRIRVYFTSHGGVEVAAPAGPVNAKIVAGGEERTLALEVLGDSVVGADGAFPFTEGMTVEITIERGETAPLVIRFAPSGYAGR